jgi:hypothetical protein
METKTVIEFPVDTTGNPIQEGKYYKVTDGVKHDFVRVEAINTYRRVLTVRVERGGPLTKWARFDVDFDRTRFFDWKKD